MAVVGGVELLPTIAAWSSTNLFWSTLESGHKYYGCTNVQKCFVIDISRSDKKRTVLLPALIVLLFVYVQLGD
jgi:hypothetical protein